MSLNNKPTVIGALDLKRIQGDELKHQAIQIEASKGLELSKRSKDRIKNWDSTIAGQRRRRIQGRQDHLNALEAERKRMDAIYAKENDERQQQILDRAKELLYAEKDEGKTFHSKVLLFQVLQERDEQLAQKAKRQDFFKMYDQIYLESIAKNAVKDDIARLRQEETLYIQKHNTKKELEETIKEKELARKQQRQQQLEEGKLIRDSDNAYLQGQKELHKKHLDKQKQNLETLKSQLQAVKDARALEKEEDRISDEKIKQWSAKKEKQSALKQAMEKEIIAQSIRIRERLALEQKQQEDNRDNETESRIEKAVQKKDEEARLQRAREIAKKERNAKDLCDYFHETQERQRREQQEAQREAKQLLEAALEAGRQAERDAAAYKKKQLEKSKQQEAENLEIWRQATETKNELRREARKAQIDLVGDEVAREENLLSYMKSISNQEWAQNNWRLQKYVNEYETSFSKNKQASKSAKPSEIVSGSHGKTKDRVGFGGDYSEIDFTKSN